MSDFILQVLLISDANVCIENSSIHDADDIKIRNKSNKADKDCDRRFDKFSFKNRLFAFLS
jgi:hypothetical protein